MHYEPHTVVARTVVDSGCSCSMFGVSPCVAPARDSRTTLPWSAGRACGARQRVHRVRVHKRRRWSRVVMRTCLWRALTPSSSTRGAQKTDSNTWHLKKLENVLWKSTVKNEAFRIQYSVLYCFDKQNQGFGQKSGFTGSLQVLSPVTKSCMSAVTSIDAVTCSVFFSTKVCFTFTFIESLAGFREFWIVRCPWRVWHYE